MKATVMAAAALLGGASAHNHQRHAHAALHDKRGQNETGLVCSETVETITGDFIWVPTPNAPPANPPTSTAYVTVTPPAAPIPTPAVQTCPTPGTYTFPATTVTVNETTTAIVPSTTPCAPGVHTLGGVTTVVENATTIVCPYAAVQTNNGTVVSVIESTTYVCPAAGTYTVGPITTTVTEVETVTVPELTTIEPGVYTAPPLTTVVETSTVVYCPFEAVTPTSTSSSTSTSSTPTSVPETSAPAAPVVPSSPAAPSAPAPVASSAAPSSAAPSAAPSSSSSPSSPITLGGDGKSPWSLTYTPYNSKTGQCQTAEAVMADVAAIAAAGFQSLRVYSTDCDTLPNVGAAVEKHGLKMIVGIYIGSAGCTNASPDVEEQISEFKAWARWDLVELFSVANEAINNGFCTGQELAALITHVRSELPAYGGPWTTTDVVSAWEMEGVPEALCPVVDHPSANAHSYFTATVAPEDAGDFVLSQIAIVEKACGGAKRAYILESGYPTAGSTVGLNVPSLANQAVAIKSILDKAGERVVLFSMFDDLWKAPGAYNCEQSWGIAPTLFGTLGQAWQALVEVL